MCVPWTDDAALLRELPDEVDVVIDAPRFSHIKRRDDDGIDFVSPLPCPFNYGSVPGTRAADGDQIDAIVLGPRLPRHTRVRVRVLGVARFIDAGDYDPKWVCAREPLSALDRAQLDAFFRLYVLAKRALNRVRGRHGESRYQGLVLR